MKNWALIMAAGRGKRAGLGMNKVFVPMKGRTVLQRCIDVFIECGYFDGITVVLSAEDMDTARSLGIVDSVQSIALGGKSRRESVCNGLRVIPDDVEIVAVHDAARPFITRELIKATLDSAQICGSGVISTPVTDTIKTDDGGKIRTLDRKKLFAVQTPQTFDLKKLKRAHERARLDDIQVTDDAELFELFEGNVKLVTAPGAEKNIKLTYRSDFDLEQPDFRVGHGYDAHRLKEGRKLVLCGVEIPYEKGLDGHSDADVAVHALMDAMLGAAALGDIGRHFPDNDDRYLGISSMKLLNETVIKLRDAGYRVSNADVTIIAQRPKLAGYMEQMRVNIADLLQLDAARVNVKATTTEKMGFEGAGEGISSHAVVIIKSI